MIPDSVIFIGRQVFEGCTNLESIYYGASESKWKAVTVDFDNSAFYNATLYYYSYTEPTKEGNYWYYQGTSICVWQGKVTAK